MWLKELTLKEKYINALEPLGWYRILMPQPLFTNMYLNRSSDKLKNMNYYASKVTASIVKHEAPSTFNSQNQLHFPNHLCLTCTLYIVQLPTKLRYSNFKNASVHYI